MTRANTFTFLRLCAALFVVVAHCNGAFGSTHLEPVLGYVQRVPFFFILGGLLLWSPAEKAAAGRTWRRFFTMRFIRLAPGLYLFTVVAPLVLAAFGFIPWAGLLTPGVLLYAVCSFVFVAGYDAPVWASVGDGSINGQLYTIPAEVSFYLVLPLILWAAVRFGFVRTMLTLTLVSVLTAMVVSMSSPGVFEVIHHTLFERLACFVAGVTVGRYWNRIPLTWPLFGLALVLYVGVQFVGAGTEWYDTFKIVLISSPMAYLVLFVGLKGPLVLEKFAIGIGDISYPIYLWHFLFIGMVETSGVATGLGATLLVLATTIAVALVAEALVKRPTQRARARVARWSVAAAG